MQLGKKQMVTVSFMLFSLFFGAGNLIFPPFLGQNAGAAMVPALAGFLITAVILPVLGVIVVAKFDGLQALAAQVRGENGSIICRELVGAAGKDTAPTPDKRTADYYKKRPCPKLIASVAAALATYLEMQKEDAQ